MTTPSVPSIPDLAERLREAAQARDLEIETSPFAQDHIFGRNLYREALEELSRLKAGEGWQPIETCPRGIAVLASDGETAVIGSLTLGSGWEFAGRPLASQPTLWHRLPTPERMNRNGE